MKEAILLRIEAVLHGSGSYWHFGHIWEHGAPADRNRGWGLTSLRSIMGAKDSTGYGEDKRLKDDSETLDLC
jgi:hypothetical protein